MPAKFFAGVTWQVQLAWLPVSALLRLIIQVFITSIEAVQTAEQELTRRMMAIQVRAVRCWSASRSLARPSPVPVRLV